MLRTQISFDEDLYREATATAKNLNISLAELCRRALRQTLQQLPKNKTKKSEKNPWLKYAGTAKGKPSDSRNSNIDSVVYGRKEP
jgi:metal-responsive CopG/Arc/MetJ family transcriptional regulator